MKVGFIGLGIMGKPMSMNLLKAGNELVVFDFNETAVAEVVAAGAKGVKSGAEVAAECDSNHHNGSKLTTCTCSMSWRRWNCRGSKTGNSCN